MNLFQSVTFKVLGIGFLALLMLIPLVQVQDLVRERRSLRDDAVARISERWGAAQTMGGPVLAMPGRASVKDANGWQLIEKTEILLPDRLDIAGSMDLSERAYGIYAVPVYQAQLKLHAKFLVADVKALANGELHAQVARAELRLPFSDVRGLRAVTDVRIDGKPARFAPAAGDVAGLSAIAVPVDLSTIGGDSWEVDAMLTLAGTERIEFLPFSRDTQVRLRAPWGSPSFVGAFLPATHEVGEKEFGASWQVLDLNRRIAQHWTEGTLSQVDLAQSAFGVQLYEPVGIYQQNERAGKYGILFVGLTFITFFLFEVLRKMRVHPVQYLLIGLALATFYVVLLALSEQIGFAWAYLIAAAAVVVMVGGYASSVLAARRAGLTLGAVLGVVYGLLYGLVVSEQYSLSIGAVALLLVVGLLMYLTRKVDWYAMGRREVAAA